MNINIYDEASMLALSTTERNFSDNRRLSDKHTISSRNKQKTFKSTLISQSDCTVQQYVTQMETTNTRRKPRNNVDMYELGMEFLNHKQQKQEYLQQQLEKQRMQDCPFQPILNQNSDLISTNMRMSGIQPRRKTSTHMDSQTLKLDRELDECTFSPRILRTAMDKFDRQSPMYDRNLQWRESILQKNAENQIKQQSQMLSKIFVKQNPKQLDLRAQHALRKNISAKYLRQSMGEYNSQ